MKILLELFLLEDKEQIKENLYYKNDIGNSLIYIYSYYHKLICCVVRRNRKN